MFFSGCRKPSLLYPLLAHQEGPTATKKGPEGTGYRGCLGVLRCRGYCMRFDRKSRDSGTLRLGKKPKGRKSPFSRMYIPPAPQEKNPSKAESGRWPGDSQRESGQFARIDSQKNPYFHNVRPIRANHLKPAIRNFQSPKARFSKKGFSSGTLTRFARIRRFLRICKSIRANRAI